MNAPYKSYEEQYVENVRNIMNHGVLVKNDRTGVGTKFLTGMTWKANLQKEFPLLTTKWVGIKDVFAELKVFISGSTNNNDFLAEGCKIWNEWAGEIGMLGPIYSAMWRRRPAAVVLYEARPLNYHERHDRYTPVGYGKGPHHLPPKENKYKRLIAKIHHDVVSLCQEESFLLYNPWFNLENFASDFFKIPGCEQIISNYNGYKPSVHGLFTNLVGPQTLMFIPAMYTEMYPEKEVNGVPMGPVFFIDQLGKAVEELRKGSTSRRIIVDCWEPSVLPLDGVKPSKQPELGRSVLACCHDHFQFHYLPPAKKGDKPLLNLTATIRSNDTALGNPYNMASYALLLMKVSKILGYTANEVTLQTGDTHVYLNHIETLRKQIRRKIHKAPVVTLTGEQTRLEDFTKEDVHITRFNKGIKTFYPVAV